MPTVAELLAALPADEPASATFSEEHRFDELIETISQRPVPVGMLRRLSLIGGLQARIALAYLSYWIRGLFRDADKQQQALLEVNLRTAIRMLDTMGYMRGAVMKVGQMIANFPDIVPDQFVETLSRLHFGAPPMHYSLLREHIRNELGRDPEELFESFETKAFAAASLGQVHRARLRTGEDVAVKIQYPGIARTIRSDFRILATLMAPLRLTKDWESVKEQFNDVRRGFEMETDYEKEADSLRAARRVFDEDDGIIIPEVHEQFCTRRVLTMEFIDGKTTDEFLATNPSQELRNQFGEKIYRSGCRLFFRTRMYYADPHPGNYLFLDDGRLGHIDFGYIREFSDNEWDYVRRGSPELNTTREQVLQHVQLGLQLSDEEMIDRSDFVDLIAEGCHLYWEPMVHDGPFDFGNADYIRRMFEFFGRAMRSGFPRQQPVNWVLNRGIYESAGLLYRLRAQVDCKTIGYEESKASRWQWTT